MRGRSLLANGKQPTYQVQNIIRIDGVAFFQSCRKLSFLLNGPTTFNLPEFYQVEINMKLQDKIGQNYIVREKILKITYRLISSLLEASEVEITRKQKLNAGESSSSIQNLKPRTPVRFLRDLRTYHPSPLFSRRQHDLNMLHSKSY